MKMNAYDYVLKRKIGYFAVRYLKYLEANYPGALERMMERDDRAEILLLVQQHCQYEMQNLMEMLDGGKGHMKRHHGKYDESKNLQDLLYEYIVKEAKDLVFDSSMDLLKYASWMSE